MTTETLPGIDTYFANLDAQTAAWEARRVTDAHEAKLDDIEAELGRLQLAHEELSAALDNARYAIQDAGASETAADAIIETLSESLAFLDGRIDCVRDALAATEPI